MNGIGKSESMRPSNSDSGKPESFAPKQTRNYMMAAELSVRIGDADNAAQLYKGIGRTDLANSIKKSPENIKIDPQARNLLERLMRKVVRWLTVREEWEKQSKGYYKRSDKEKEKERYADEYWHIELGDEPKFNEVIGAFGGYEKFEATLTQLLGSYKVELTKIQPDHPYEPIHQGVQLAAFGDEVLILGSGGGGLGHDIFLTDRKRVIPIPPSDLK